MAYTVHLTTGTPVTGLWCDTCQLPAGYEVPIYAMGEDGPWRIGLVRKCHDCDRDL